MGGTADDAAVVARPAVQLSRRRRGVRYRRLLVCLSPGDAAARAVDVGCRLAAEHGSRLTALAVIEVPLEVPLETPDPEAEAAARAAVRRAQAIADKYGVPVEGVVLHARETGEAIVAEAADHAVEAIVVAPVFSQRQPGRRLDPTTTYVLKNVDCRVILIGASGVPAEPAFRARAPRDYWPEGSFVDPETRR